MFVVFSECVQDTLLVIDQSASIQISDWDMVARYMELRVNMTDFTDQTGNRIGVLQFDVAASILCPLTFDKTFLLNCIRKIIFPADQGQGRRFGQLEFLLILCVHISEFFVNLSSEWPAGRRTSGSWLCIAIGNLPHSCFPCSDSVFCLFRKVLTTEQQARKGTFYFFLSEFLCCHLPANLAWRVYETLLYETLMVKIQPDWHSISWWAMEPKVLQKFQAQCSGQISTPTRQHQPPHPNALNSASFGFFFPVWCFVCTIIFTEPFLMCV